jgi:hypothetical protein
VKLPFPLQPDERVVLITRRHWLYFVPRFVAEALAGLLPAALLLLLLNAAGALHGTALKVALVVCLVWLTFWVVRIALAKYRYDHDLWVLTDRRIVDLVATSPVHFRMSAAGLTEIEDITTSINGPLQALFGYGNLECQTAGEVRHFSLRGIPNPRQLAAAIEHETLVAKGRMPASPREAPTEPLH